MKLKCPNLRISEPLSNKFQLAYFYLSETIQIARFNMRHPLYILRWLGGRNTCVHTCFISNATIEPLKKPIERYLKALKTLTIFLGNLILFWQMLLFYWICCFGGCLIFLERLVKLLTNYNVVYGRGSPSYGLTIQQI